ncbi:MAG: hypothetical protein ACI35W_05495 [Anaeroplasmataceae bacterium]
MAKTKYLIKKYSKEILEGRDLEGNYLTDVQLAYRRGFLEVKCKSTSWEQLYNKYLNARSETQKSYFSGALARYKSYIKAMNNLFNNNSVKVSQPVSVPNYAPRRFNDDPYFNEF